MKKSDGTSKNFVEYQSEHLAAHPKVVQIAAAGSGAVGGHILDLNDKQKRWIVTGVCLNKVITPQLRQFLEPQLLTLYNNLKGSHNIHIQTFPKQLKKDGTKSLNYDSINNNIRHKKKVSLYDYKVQSHIDLAKMYLQAHMAKFNGFDESLDASAALGLLCEVPILKAVEPAARDVRADVRNEWGHCNFSVWDGPKLQDCFQKMKDLVKSLSLPKKDTDDILDELDDWYTKGTNLCMSSYVDKDLVKALYHEVSVVANYSLDINDEVQKELEDICDKLNETLKWFDQRLKEVEIKQQKEEHLLQELSQTQESQKAKLALLEIKDQELEIAQATVEKDVAGLVRKQEKASVEVKELKTVQEKMGKKMDKLDTAIESCSERQAVLHSNIRLNKENMFKMNKKIENVEEKFSRPVTSGNIFQAPNQNKYFSGREKEMTFLEDQMVNTRSCSEAAHRFVGICGLGGCGKTALVCEFSWRFKDMYPGGIFWISAENETFFRNTVNELALDLKTFQDNFDNCLRQTLDCLSVLPSTWLLVVDNADQLDLGINLRKVLSGRWKRNSKGHILVTTRRKSTDLCENCDLKENDCITLECLNKEDAIRFMSIRTAAAECDDNLERKSCPSGSGNERAKEELVVELGCLPLALEQAAAHIKTLSCSFQDYLLKYHEQKLKLLQQRKVMPSSEEFSKERLTVHTTWLVNFNYVSAMASECGLEKFVSVVVNVSAFLAPDDIPFEIINPGFPVLDLEGYEKQNHNLTVSQTIDILTRFSLFCSNKKQVFSVHTLVQEVIRSNHASELDTRKTFQCAIRMLNYAFGQTTNPIEILNENAVNKTPSSEQSPALTTWEKLASHATVLKDNLILHIQANPEAEPELLYCEETATLMQQTAIYYSMSDQQPAALESQKRRLNIVASLRSCSTDGALLLDGHSLRVPLTDKQQKILRSHVQCNLRPPDVDIKTVECPVNVDELRKLGNAAVGQQHYDKAIDLYTSAIELVEKQTISPEKEAVLYCNRAHCYLKQSKPSQALADADSCIKKSPYSWKGHCRKAVAISILAKTGEKECELSARASAAMAVHLNRECENHSSFREHFTNGCPPFVYVTTQSELEKALQLDKIVILRKGKYSFPNFPYESFGKKNFVLIGEYCVEVGKSVVFLWNGKFHLENICFDRANIVAMKCNGSAINCTFKNGDVDFISLDEGMKTHNPLCTGCLYCMAKNFPFDEEKLPGGLGLLGMYESSVLVKDCTLTNGAGGVLAKGDNCRVKVIDCVIFDHKLAAVEAREGGSLHVEGNVIHSANWQGVCVGPGAVHCLIKGNHIHNHSSHGVFVHIESKDVTIEENKIFQNGEHGIMVSDKSLVSISKNTIFENWFWGIYIKCKSSAVIKRNDIYSNKCGGIRILANKSVKVILQNNTVRDHNGPGVYAETSTFEVCSDGLLSPCSDPPVMIDNVLERNEEGQQHPKEAPTSFGTTCSYCNRTRMKEERLFSLCGKCRKVAYCGKECQTLHWKIGHKAMCKMVVEKYSVLVEVFDYERNVIHAFDSRLKGIKKGPKPDRRSDKRFIIKIQIPENVNRNDKCQLVVYDQSTDVDFTFENPTVFHIVAQCGVLGVQKITGKKIFCWAAFEEGGKKLRIYLDELAPFQTW